MGYKRRFACNMGKQERKKRNERITVLSSYADKRLFKETVHLVRGLVCCPGKVSRPSE